MSKVEIVEVLEKQKHMNADYLYVYVIKTDSHNQYQVIANTENIYEPSDNVIYVNPGSILNDGTKINKRKIRGLDSYGMLIGKSDLPIGIDLTDKYCQKQEKPIGKIKRTNLKFQKWPSIERLSNVVKTYSLLKKQNKLDLYNNYVKGQYFSKVKLHGTNAAITITSDGEVVAQKRTSIIYPDQDNCGFATWVHQNKDFFSRLKRNKSITLHGEWAGPNIQKGVAVSVIPNKSFFIFALQLGEQQSGAQLITYPDQIYHYIYESIYKDDVFVEDLIILPIYKTYNINFEDPINLGKFSNNVAKDTLEVEACDPVIKYIYDIDGIGEGLVLYPLVTQAVDMIPYMEFVFKAKGDKHSVTKVKKVAQVDVEKLENVHQFVEMFLTENRLLQGVCEACNDEYDTKLIGKFLSWINADVLKESKAELEESGLDWKKDINKILMTMARQWYQNRISKSLDILL